jgi:hypothetical protein
VKEGFEHLLRWERVGMRWGRSSQRFGACVALFALCFQFAVSFGHVHPGSFASPFVPPSAQLWATPPTGGQDGLPQDECPICSSINLISSAMIGPPPPFDVPASVNSIVVPILGEFDFRTPRYLSFRTRAPPVI